MSTVVEAWFGDAFAELHPLLQRLHREGGTLTGEVNVAFGRGMARFIGQRIAQRLGIPVTSGLHRFEVEIYSDDGLLHWNRRFNEDHPFVSTFVPVGCYPAGHWVEQSGVLKLFLGVRIVDGGWHWDQRAATLCGLPLLGFLLPKTLASKRVVQGMYCFKVEVIAPVLGTLLRYEGTLQPAVKPRA